MRVFINPEYAGFKNDILEVVAGNYVADKVFCNRRNVVEKITLQGVEIVVKRYRQPNLFNRFAYTCLRKSKARRAYEYAFKLLAKGVDTPLPVAYVEVYTGGLFSVGYFFSLYMPHALLCDLGKCSVPCKGDLAADLAGFVLSLHSLGILPGDFNPGNVFFWFNEADGRYNFALTDINRMRFGKRPSVSEAMRSIEQLGAGIDGLYRLAACYSSQRDVDVEYAVFTLLFHRIKKKVRRALKQMVKQRRVLL